ncbi:MAG TPA: lipase maturation factor family protein [Terriglobia bacterium]|nr:lipase maturation factor family protein [Terriglobia bacterium]
MGCAAITLRGPPCTTWGCEKTEADDNGGMDGYFGDVWLVRLLVTRALAAIYLIAFIVVLRQFKPLAGERGLLPAPSFLRRADFSVAPSLFLWRYSDRLLDAAAWSGIGLAILALAGVVDAAPFWVSAGAWLALWNLYLSIVTIGQRFYAFGWESMLLEAGFFATFLGPSWMAPSVIPVLILRWMLFRTELGAGLIKLRHDPCWRDLTCLMYHYETQPLPNPLSWYFHRMPGFMHRFSVLFSHFVQVIVPFALFAPQPFTSVAGALIIFHQLWLIVSGNYSWLNWLTVVLGLTAFNDATLAIALPITIPRTLPRDTVTNLAMIATGVATAILSVQPVRNMFSRNQVMNTSYNRFHLINTYGAFGSVTKHRYEVVIEGTSDTAITPRTQWQEYGFNGKPGDTQRRPPQVAPYHLRLDWLMWFLPFSVQVTTRGIRLSGYERWFIALIRKLLEHDPATLKLLRHSPFRETPPTFVRALFYSYRYTTPEERKETGAWWTRRLIDVYLPPVSLRNLAV